MLFRVLIAVLLGAWVVFLPGPARSIEPPLSPSAAYRTSAGHPLAMLSPAEEAPSATAAAPQIQKQYGKIPLSFEANTGNYDKEAQFVVRGSSYTLAFAPNAITLNISKRSATGEKAIEVKDPAINTAEEKAKDTPVQFTTVRTTFPGANQSPKIEGLDQQQKRTNYLFGKDQSKWRRNIPNYARVKYSELYPGIDLIYYGNQEKLEYDFVLAPQANPSQIALQFEGAQQLAGLARIFGDLVQKMVKLRYETKTPILYFNKSQMVMEKMLR